MSRDYVITTEGKVVGFKANDTSGCRGCYFLDYENGEAFCALDINVADCTDEETEKCLFDRGVWKEVDDAEK